MLILAAARDAAVGVRHELLQLLLKGLRTLGRTVLTRGASVLLRTAVLLGTALAPLRLLRPLDGKADLARRVNADDLDLDVLPLRQMIVDVADICIGDLRNVHHARAVFRQGDEYSEFCDGLDLALE